MDKLKVALFKESLEILERNISDLKKISEIKDIKDLEDVQKQELKEYLDNVKDSLCSDFRYFKTQYDDILKNLESEEL